MKGFTPRSEIWRSGRRGLRPSFGTPRRRVFADAMFAGVVNADDDQGSHRAATDQVIGDVWPTPQSWPGTKEVEAIKKILPVVKIQDRETALGLFVVTGRKINDEVAFVF